MKKVLAILLAMLVIVSIGSTAVFAAKPSREPNGIVSEVFPDCIILEKIDEQINKVIKDVIEELKKEEDDDTLKPVDWYDIIVIGNPKFDVEVTLGVLGVKPSSKVYILLENKETVEVIRPKVENGKIIFDLPKGFDRLAIVMDGKSALQVETENGVTSPQTGDVATYAVVIMAVMSLAIVFVSKKVKA